MEGGGGGMPAGGGATPPPALKMSFKLGAGAAFCMVVSIWDVVPMSWWDMARCGCSLKDGPLLKEVWGLSGGRPPEEGER